MKKIIAILLVSVFLLSLAGCGSEKMPNTDGTPSPQTSGNQNSETTPSTNSAISESSVSQQGAISGGAVSGNSASKNNDSFLDETPHNPDLSTTPDGDGSSHIINNSAPARISKNDAKKIALNHAGLSGADVHDFEIELDMEAGVLTYEISFNHKNTEYDYDIKASDGTILKSHKEYDD